MRRVARRGKFRARRGGGQGLQCEAYRDITRYRHRETLIAKLTEVQHAVEQLLAELQASERDKVLTASAVCETKGAALPLFPTGAECLSCRRHNSALGSPVQHKRKTLA